jgi:hypothetical protein
MEARESMLDFIKMLPDAAPFVIDLLAKNMDWPGADEIAKRLRQMVPPQALADPNQPPPPPPNPMDDPTIAVEVNLKQAQTEKTIAEAEKIRREASLPVDMAGNETPDEEHQEPHAEHHQGITTTARASAPRETAWIRSAYLSRIPHW